MKKQHLLGVAASVALFAGTPITAFAATTSTTYKVKWGDTYYKIGQAVHQPFSVLEDINSPGDTELMPGQVLQLADAYTVRSGDTMWKIAQAHDQPLSELLRLNPMQNPNDIYPGETLWLAPAGQASSTAGNAEQLPPTVTPVSDSGAPSSSGDAASGSSSASAPVSTPSSPSASKPSGEEIVAYAKQFLGVPYQWGGESTSGFDCSGLVQTVYAHFGIDLPRTAAEQHSATSGVSESDLHPGDLVFFDTTGNTYSHDGIYIGNGQFISATTSKGVRICDVNDPYYWGSRFTGATDPLS